MKEKNGCTTPGMKYVFYILYQKHLQVSDRWHNLGCYWEILLHVYAGANRQFLHYNNVSFLLENNAQNNLTQVVLSI